MPIVKADLLAFNNVETTDPILSQVTLLPFHKPAAYVRGITYTDGFQQYIRGNQGFGSQVLIRELGKGSATVVKATAAGALRYTHAETADDLVVVPLDDVIKQSEEIYELVEVARQSATGALKANIVLNNILEKAQELITGYLAAAVNRTAVVALTKANVKDQIAATMKELDVVPDILAVSKETHALLLQVVTDGAYTPINGFDTVRTGLLPRFMGMLVVVDYNLPAEFGFIMYNKDYFAVFTVLEKLTIVPAIDFDGSYARGIALQGGYGRARAKGNGAWGVAHLIAAE